ncbi:unnamed protein product, partial [Rotaria magnacalcarata]
TPPDEVKPRQKQPLSWYGILISKHTPTPTPTPTTTTAPPDALPQRERFATTRNTTQPFVVNQDNQQPQQRQQPQQQQNQRQRRITSFYRRQQGRNNRFAVLADENEDEENNIEMDIKDEPMPFKAYNKK